MDNDPNKPPIIPPPVHPGPGSKFGRSVGTIGTGALILAKFSKVFLTLGTMFLSMLLYAQIWGWKFAAGFVICILIHELGHVIVAKACGHPVSAPMFIPFMGALIVGRQEKSAWESALIGIGGPLFGAMAAIVCWGIYQATGNGLYLGLAYTTFFLNLFNMMPIFPMDGGRIVGGVHPVLWLLGIIGMVVLFAMGIVRNPMLIILVILSADRLIVGLLSKSVDVGYAEKTTTEQRWIMGVSYVALSGILLWGMSTTHDMAEGIRTKHRMEQRLQKQIAPQSNPENNVS